MMIESQLFCYFSLKMYLNPQTVVKKYVSLSKKFLETVLDFEVFNLLFDV